MSIYGSKFPLTQQRAGPGLTVTQDPRQCRPGLLSRQVLGCTMNMYSMVNILIKFGWYTFVVGRKGLVLWEEKKYPLHEVKSIKNKINLFLKIKNQAFHPWVMCR